MTTALAPDALGEFEQLRSRLLGIAYRIVGNRAEAEDVVQDAWLRWQMYDRSAVLNPTAFLVTTTTRLAINVSTSARARRETYVGDRLPEPVDASDEPATEVERREALQHGVQLMVQRLAPTERAAFVLRQAFDYPYSRIATILRTSEANARQLVSRAGRNIAVAQSRPTATAEQRHLVHAVSVAVRHGDLSALEDLFAVSAVSGSRFPSTDQQKADNHAHPRANHRPRPRSVRRVRQLEPGHRATPPQRHISAHRSTSGIS